MGTTLPEGLMIRPATLGDDDTEAIYNLLRAYEFAHCSEAETTLDDVRNWHSAPEVNLAEDTCLVFDQAGQLIGWFMLEQHLNTKFFVTVRILPGYSDPQIGDYLMNLGETWAHERMVKAEPGARVTLTGWVPSADQTGIQLYEKAGFKENRRHWRMEIELAEAPAAPGWPEGLELRPFVPEYDARVVFEMVETAFQDHWGYIPHKFEEFQHYMIGRANFDPTLWFIAYEGDQIAGGSLCVAEEGLGWVNTLGILRPWRRKGLGLALLRHSFGEFYRRGLHKAGLGVDSQNLTGATRLYTRAGMHMAREYISFEKELRAGVELSTQALPV